ncbi:MAG: MYXO-CTERM sorting domain-containing protein [Planctomycetota bacterium]
MFKLTSACVVVLAAGASAQVIDFETTPAGLLPTDNAFLDRTAQYFSDGVGVSFGFDTTNDGLADTDAAFEAVGDEPSGPEGFFSTLGPQDRDTEAPAFAGGLGGFFLRTPNDVLDNDDPSTFVITYDTAVAELSGEIWDIDGRENGTFEQWRVRAFNASGSQVASQDSPVGIFQGDPGTLDSAPWMFNLSSGAGITRVTIEYIGDADGVGLAFDNYNATQVPTPGAGALALAGLAIAGRRRRK